MGRVATTSNGWIPKPEWSKKFGLLFELSLFLPNCCSHRGPSRCECSIAGKAIQRFIGLNAEDGFPILVKLPQILQKVFFAATGAQMVKSPFSFASTPIRRQTSTILMATTVISCLGKTPRQSVSLPICEIGKRSSTHKGCLLVGLT